MKKICIIVGARPNFMKAAPILKEIKKRNMAECFLIHTNQHYDKNLTEFFFRDLELPQPVVLENISTEAIRQIADIKIALEGKFKEIKPDLVIVVGDVNSTFAAAFVANRLGIRVAHVEAGLRSFDRTMPEEINRILVDSISDYHFVTEKSAKDNLLREGAKAENIHFVGNTMIDTLLSYKETAESQSDILSRAGVLPGDYAVLTLHRPANVDDAEIFGKLMLAAGEILKKIKIVFPVHPRTKKNLEGADFGRNLILTEPLGYLDFVKLMKNAKLILTDSGGIQEEATVLGVPCLTLRENTERPSTIESGMNILTGRDPVKIIAETEKILSGVYGAGRAPELWDGMASARIIDILEKIL